jgi:hypothetical protein
METRQPDREDARVGVHRRRLHAPIDDGTGPSRLIVALVRFTPGAHTN